MIISHELIDGHAVSCLSLILCRFSAILGMSTRLARGGFAAGVTTFLDKTQKTKVDAAALINTLQRFTTTMSTLLTSVVIPITLDCRLTTKLAGSLDEIGTSYPIREKVHK